MRSWVLILVTLALAQSAVAQVVPDWSEQTHEPFPLMPATLVEPVLTGDDVTDVPAIYVADPFLMHESGGPWHMFLEVYESSDFTGRIGHATSPDGIHWTYDRIVLDTSYHLSFPYVFKYNSNYFMIVHNSTRNEVLLYRARNYPYDWTPLTTLLTGRAFADPAIIRYNGIWYLFVGHSSGRECWLYWSYQPTGGWVEHPFSPIVRDFGNARPAGRPFLFGGRLIRLAQKNDDYYGEAVRAFEVDALTPTQYAEHEIPESPILRPGSGGWNGLGMHTCDAWWDGDHWIASVDGNGDLWSIGIYRTAAASGVEGGIHTTDPLRIDLGQNSPNPFNGSTEIVVRLAGPLPSGAASPLLGIYDASGRLVRSLDLAGGAGGVVRVSWNGADVSGRRASPGTYYYRLDPSRGSIAKRMTLIR